jgi:asparagine synthase (glutamine-hydrolysing)
MCGIAGFRARDGRLDEALLRVMNEQIVRRGPDGEGIYFDGDVGLAMRRLAIIDLEGGRQPIFNEDGTVCVVFNGEIYNYRELRTALQARGHRFATHSDTEVIVHLYEEHGPDFARHLAGMFGIALWDIPRKRLVLARDRLGQKPLFIARLPQGVLFGSEIKSLIATNLVPRAIDPQALDEYLTYNFIPAPRSIYCAIRKIAPGTTLTIERDGTEHVQTYWSVPTVPVRSATESEWIDRCEAALQDAVRSHLVSDVPVGAFLSGGLDSGVLVAMMAKTLKQPVQTFTVGFSQAGSAFLDERKYARMLVERYGLEHREIDVEPHVEDIIGEIVRAFDEPFADDSVVPSYYVSQAAARHVKVAITGLGGDELFAGYRRHFAMVLGERYAQLPRFLRKGLIEPIVRRLPESRNSSDRVDHLKRFVRAADFDAGARYQDALTALPRSERHQLLSQAMRAQIDADATDRVVTDKFGGPATGSELVRALRTDLEFYLVDDILTLTDRLSMWHSLELRVPFLDHPLVELMQSAPDSLRIRGQTQKYLLKKLAERWLPREMIYHRKQGFEAPMGHWLRGPLLPYFDKIVNRETVREHGLVDYDVVVRLRDEHVSGARKNSKIMFSLLMLHAWLRAR